jgi:hypothetical protein
MLSEKTMLYLRLAAWHGLPTAIALGERARPPAA